MMVFLKIAWRNILRNKYRSLVTITAVACGLAALIFLRAFVEGADSQMVENYTNLVSGHLEIHKKDFQKKMGLELSMDGAQGIIDIVKQGQSIVAVSKRIKEYALVSSAEHSSGVLLLGIDPLQEPKVTYLDKRIRKGRYLSVDADDEIILGKDLAEILNVSLGEKVVIMAQGADGSLASGAFRLCGILDTGAEDIDKGMALVTLKAAQQMLVLEDRISEVAIRTKSVFKADRVLKELSNKIDLHKFEVLTWKQISPMTAQWLEFDRAFINAILLIVLLVVASGIFNTILMSVLDRIREFGIMLALGTKRRQVVFMIGLESAILGFIGILLGGLLGCGASFYFGHRGIDLSKFATALESYYTGSVIYPRLGLGYVFLFSCIILVVSIIVAIYPTFKAVNLKPVEAIHHF